MCGHLEVQLGTGLNLCARFVGLVRSLRLLVRPPRVLVQDLDSRLSTRLPHVRRGRCNYVRRTDLEMGFSGSGRTF